MNEIICINEEFQDVGEKVGRIINDILREIDRL